jgi:hypothetical protein
MGSWIQMGENQSKKRRKKIQSGDNKKYEN